MVKPFDSDHHVVPPGFPHALDAANVGQVGAASREENCAVSDADDLLAPHYGLVEQFPGLPFHSSSLPREDHAGGSARDHPHSPHTPLFALSCIPLLLAEPQYSHEN